MRTTVDLPDGLYEHVRDRAHLRKTSMSQAIVELMERGLRLPDAELRHDPLTGFTVMHFGEGTISTEQVRALLDEGE